MLGSINRSLNIVVRTRFLNAGPFAAYGYSPPSRLKQMFQGARVPVIMDPVYAKGGAGLRLRTLMSTGRLPAASMAAADLRAVTMYTGQQLQAAEQFNQVRKDALATETAIRDMQMGQLEILGKQGKATLFARNAYRAKSSIPMLVPQGAVVPEGYTYSGGGKWRNEKGKFTKMPYGAANAFSWKASGLWAEDSRFSSEELYMAQQRVAELEKAKKISQAVKELQAGTLAIEKQQTAQFTVMNRLRASALRPVIGRVAGFGALALGGMGILGGYAAAGFQQQMLQVKAHMKMGTAQFQKMQQFVLDWASRSGANMQDTAYAVMRGVTHGYRLKKAEGLARLATKLGTPLGMPVQDTANYIASAAVSFKDKNLANVAALIRLAGQLGNVKIPQLMTGFPTISSLSAAVGGPNAMVASLASSMALTQTGLSVPQTMTQIRNLLNKIANPSPGQVAAAQQLGITDYNSAGLAQHGLVGILEQIRSARQHGANIKDILHLMPNLRGTAGFLGLTKYQGSSMVDIYRQLLHLQKSGGAGGIDKTWSSWLGTPLQQARVLRENLKAFMVSFGGTTLPIITTFLKDFLNPVAHSLSAFARTDPGKVKAIFFGLTGLLTAIWGMNKVVGVISKLTTLFEIMAGLKLSRIGTHVLRGSSPGSAGITPIPLRKFRLPWGRGGSTADEATSVLREANGLAEASFLGKLLRGVTPKALGRASLVIPAVASIYQAMGLPGSHSGVVNALSIQGMLGGIGGLFGGKLGSRIGSGIGGGLTGLGMGGPALAGLLLGAPLLALMGKQKWLSKIPIVGGAYTIEKAMMDHVGHLKDMIFSKFGDLVPGWFRSWGFHAIHSFGDGLGSASSWLKGKVSGAWGIISQLGTWALQPLNGPFSWGMNVVTNIGNGIVRGGSFVKKSALGVFNDIKGWLGFGSPPPYGSLKDDPYVWGSAITGNIGKALEAGRGSILAKAQSISKGIESKLSNLKIKFNYGYSSASAMIQAAIPPRAASPLSQFIKYASGNTGKQFMDEFGYQCTVLAANWLKKMGLAVPNARYASEWVRSPLFKMMVPSGFKGHLGSNVRRPGDVRAGDVLVWKTNYSGYGTTTHGAGHVDIFYKFGRKGGKLGFWTFDENWNTNNPRGNPPQLVWHPLAVLEGSNPGIQGWIDSPTPMGRQSYTSHGQLIAASGAYANNMMGSGIPSHWSLFQKMAARFHVPAALLAAISWGESHGGNDPKAQIMGYTLGPARNWLDQITGGAQTLRALLNKYKGNLYDALLHYGPGTASYPGYIMQFYKGFRPGASTAGTWQANAPLVVDPGTAAKQAMAHWRKVLTHDKWRLWQVFHGANPKNLDAGQLKDYISLSNDIYKATYQAAMASLRKRLYDLKNQLQRGSISSADYKAAVGIVHSEMKNDLHNYRISVQKLSMRAANLPMERAIASLEWQRRIISKEIAGEKPWNETKGAQAVWIKRSLHGLWLNEQITLDQAKLKLAEGVINKHQYRNMVKAAVGYYRRMVKHQTELIPIERLREADKRLSAEITTTKRNWTGFKVSHGSHAQITKWEKAMEKSDAMRQKLYDQEAKILYLQGTLDWKSYQKRLAADARERKLADANYMYRATHGGVSMPGLSRHVVPVRMIGHCAAEQRNENHHKKTAQNTKTMAAEFKSWRGHLNSLLMHHQITMRGYRADLHNRTLMDDWWKHQHHGHGHGQSIGTSGGGRPPSMYGNVTGPGNTNENIGKALVAIANHIDPNNTKQAEALAMALAAALQPLIHALTRHGNSVSGGTGNRPGNGRAPNGSIDLGVPTL